MLCQSLVAVTSKQYYYMISILLRGYKVWFYFFFFLGRDEKNFYKLLCIRRFTSTYHLLRWWDCIALPDDVDSSDEASFRMKIRELAFTVRQFYKDGACMKNLTIHFFWYVLLVMCSNTVETLYIVVAYC